MGQFPFFRHYTEHLWVATTGKWRAMDPTIEAVAMSTVPPDLPTCEDSPLTHESALPHQLSLLSPPKGLGNDFPSSTSSTSETISPISIPATPNSVSKELAPALNA